MMGRKRAALIAAGIGACTSVAQAESALRIAMTATDIPTTTGMPNNGFEGLRFLGYPVFEPLVQWDLTRSDLPATLKPELSERWEQMPEDKRTWL
ncbi:MAG: 4-phytase, partial [Microvirga sp.]